MEIVKSFISIRFEIKRDVLKTIASQIFRHCIVLIPALFCSRFHFFASHRYLSQVYDWVRSFHLKQKASCRTTGNLGQQIGKRYFKRIRARCSWETGRSWSVWNYGMFITQVDNSLQITWLVKLDCINNFNDEKTLWFISFWLFFENYYNYSRITRLTHEICLYLLFIVFIDELFLQISTE